MKGSEMVELLLLEQIISSYTNNEYTDTYNKLYDMEKLIERYKELTTRFMEPYVRESGQE